jgi:hypothetical protein
LNLHEKYIAYEFLFLIKLSRNQKNSAAEKREDQAKRAEVRTSVKQALSSWQPGALLEPKQPQVLRPIEKIFKTWEDSVTSTLEKEKASSSEADAVRSLSVKELVHVAEDAREAAAGEQ